MYHLVSFKDRAKALVSKLGGGESGQGMVEYALILILIAIVVIVILIVLGNQVRNVFSNVVSGLAT
jgi:pilus assembly protein Flp/PilA